MIGWLRGEVIERHEGSLVLNVQGVGYEISINAQNTARLGQTVDLHIRTVVRQDAIILFGFSSTLERDVFDLLIGVPSIGPVKAMGILGVAAADFVEMVQRRELARLSKLPGVGKKTAERILLDLPDKLIALRPNTSSPIPVQPRLASSRMRDLVSGLVNLGYRDAVAEEVAQKVIEKLGEATSLEDLLREALSTGR